MRRSKPAGGESNGMAGMGASEKQRFHGLQEMVLATIFAPWPESQNSYEAREKPPS